MVGTGFVRASIVAVSVLISELELEKSTWELTVTFIAQECKYWGWGWSNYLNYVNMQLINCGYDPARACSSCTLNKCKGKDMGLDVWVAESDRVV